MIQSDRTSQILEEVQEHILCFYQGVPIDHCIYVPGPVVQSTYESEYNASYTSEMPLANSRMINNGLFNKD